jgi:hypothetical protein
MSLSRQFQDLQTQGANFRHEIFAVDQSGNEQKFTSEGMSEPLPCYFTPVRDQQQLDQANMKEVHDAIVRINKATGFQPRLGQIVKLLNARNGGGDLTVKFEEFGHTAINPEFVIGAGNVFG